MKQTLFDQLAESVEQADAIIQGRQAPSRVTEYPEPQVKDIRAQTGLTQSGFAHVLGVSKRTLENWEQGRRQPTGPARTLLKVLEADPQYVLRTLNRE